MDNMYSLQCDYPVQFDYPLEIWQVFPTARQIGKVGEHPRNNRTTMNAR